MTQRGLLDIEWDKGDIAWQTLAVIDSKCLVQLGKDGVVAIRDVERGIRSRSKWLLESGVPLPPRMEIIAIAMASWRSIRQPLPPTLREPTTLLADAMVRIALGRSAMLGGRVVDRLGARMREDGRTRNELHDFDAAVGKYLTLLRSLRMRV